MALYLTDSRFYSFNLMKKILAFIALCSSLSLTAFSQQDYGLVVSPGTIVSKNMVNKIGVPVDGTTDFFFKTGNSEYFIKLRDSKVKAEELQRYVNKTVTLGYRVMNGNWDSGDRELETQSRVGKYIVVLLLKSEP